MKIYGKKQTNSNWIFAEDIHQKATGKILPHPCLDRSSNQKRSALIPSLVFLKESNVSKARVTQLLLSIRHKVISSDSTKPEPQSFPTQPKPIRIYTETQAKRKKNHRRKPIYLVVSKQLQQQSTGNYKVTNSNCSIELRNFEGVLSALCFGISHLLQSFLSKLWWRMKEARCILPLISNISSSATSIQECVSWPPLSFHLTSLPPLSTYSLNAMLEARREPAEWSTRLSQHNEKWLPIHLEAVGTELSISGIDQHPSGCWELHISTPEDLRQDQTRVFPTAPSSKSQHHNTCDSFAMKAKNKLASLRPHTHKPELNLQPGPSRRRTSRH